MLLNCTTWGTGSAVNEGRGEKEFQGGGDRVIVRKEVEGIDAGARSPKRASYHHGVEAHPVSAHRGSVAQLSLENGAQWEAHQNSNCR